MKVKEWSYLLIRGKNTPELIRSDVFYTSDTEAFLILKLKDARIYPKQALLNLHNLNDDSLVSETVDVNDGVIEWEMREEIIEHGGSWRAQVVYENIEDGQPKKYTSPIIGFDVKIDLLNQRTARMFAVESWERLLANAEGFVGDLDELESNYQELLNTGVLQTKINEKLEDLEDEYAPRLTNVEQNKADTSEVNQLANLKADKTYVNQLNDSTTTQLAHIDGKKIDKNRGAVTSADLSQEVKEQMTGGSVAVVGKNTVLTENIVDEQVTPEKTTFVRHSKNLYNKNTSIDNTTLVSGGEVIPHTGVAEEDLRTTSDFIPILGNTTYISNERIILQVYGEDKNPIGSLRDIHKDSPLVSVSLARYVRLSIRKTNKETFQFEQGSVPTEYEPYGLIIKDLILDSVSSFMTEENEEWVI